VAVVGGLLAGVAAVGAAATLLSASVGGRMATHRPAAPPDDGAPSDRGALPDYGLLPEFSLIDHQGRSFTRRTLQGSVWIADFIFTRCAGQCPIMSRRMAELQAALADLPQVRLVSFTVDPVYDTPGVLAGYGARFGAQPDRWVFATGQAEAIVRLAQDGFRLSVADGGPPEEPITHSVRLVLVDQAGRIRGTYDATDPATIRQLDTDVRKLLARP
jgi:protein SCO1/2